MRSLLKRWAAPATLLVVTGFLIIVPLVRLQTLAFTDGAAGYRTVLQTADLSPVVMQTIALALGSLAISMVLGVGLAWVATRLPPRQRWLGIVPILPLVIPSVASVTGWAFMFSPRTGYVNQLLRLIPGLGGETGPVDVYTAEWIIIVTGFGLTSFVYVFLRTGLRNINQELIDAAQAAGSSPVGVFFRITLPLLRAPTRDSPGCSTSPPTFLSGFRRSSSARDSYSCTHGHR